jgi:hypothetical protein
VPFTQLPSIENLANEAPVVTGGMGALGRPIFEDSVSNVAVLYSATRGTKAPDGEPNKTSYFARAISEVVNEAIDGIASNRSHVVTISDVVSDIVERVSELTQGKQNPRPDIPFPFKIPLFATEDAYQTESQEWQNLQNQIVIDGPKIPDWSAAKVKDLVYCRVREFRKAFGYAYFWRQVMAEMHDNNTPGAVSRCNAKSAIAAAPLYAPATAAVVTPAGTVDQLKIRSDTPTQPTPSPKPGSVPESGLLAAAANLNGPKAVLVKGASLYQPTFPGGARSVPLAAGQSVTFVDYGDAAKTTVRANDEKHGYGLLPADAVLVLNGVVRIALSYDPGEVDYSMRQQEALNEQLNAANVTRVAATSIRFAKSDGRLGFRRAQAIAAYLQTTPALPVDTAINAFFPDIAEDPALKPGVLTISMIIETNQTSPAAAPVAAPAAPPSVAAAPAGVHVFDAALRQLGRGI